MGKAFLILGPESSGTRLVTRILIGAGCLGSSEHLQPFDHEIPSNRELIVWRRSFPHKGQWPNVPSLISTLQWRGYHVVGVVTLRDFSCMAKSQVRTHRPDTLREAISNIRKAYVTIFTGLGKNPFFTVSYEELILRPALALESTCKLLGLEPTTDFEEIADGNEKYYAI